MLSTRDPPQNRGHIQTESEGLEKIFHANRDQKKAGVAILIASVFSMNTQGWYPSGLTGLIFLLSKGLSGVFSSTTVQKHQFFGAQPFFNDPTLYVYTLKQKSQQYYVISTIIIISILLHSDSEQFPMSLSNTRRSMILENLMEWLFQVKQ